MEEGDDKVVDRDKIDTKKVQEENVYEEINDGNRRIKGSFQADIKWKASKEQKSIKKLGEEFKGHVMPFVKEESLSNRNDINISGEDKNRHQENQHNTRKNPKNDSLSVKDEKQFSDRAVLSGEASSKSRSSVNEKGTSSKEFKGNAQKNPGTLPKKSDVAKVPDEEFSKVHDSVLHPGNKKTATDALKDGGRTHSSAVSQHRQKGGKGELKTTGAHIGEDKTDGKISDKGKTGIDNAENGKYCEPNVNNTGGGKLDEETENIYETIEEVTKKRIVYENALKSDEVSRNQGIAQHDETSSETKDDFENVAASDISSEVGGTTGESQSSLHWGILKEKLMGPQGSNGSLYEHTGECEESMEEPTAKPLELETAQKSENIDKPKAYTGRGGELETVKTKGDSETKMEARQYTMEEKRKGFFRQEAVSRSNLNRADAIELLSSTDQSEASGAATPVPDNDRSSDEFLRDDLDDYATPTAEMADVDEMFRGILATRVAKTLMEKLVLNIDVFRCNSLAMVFSVYLTRPR